MMLVTRSEPSRQGDRFATFGRGDDLQDAQVSREGKLLYFWNSYPNGRSKYQTSSR